MNNQARAPPRTSARVLAWVRASTPVRTSIPVRTPTPARASSTPARTPHPAQIPTSARTLNPVLIPTSSRAPTPVQTSTSARIPNPVQTPTPARGPTPIPTLARTLTPVQTPASAWTPNPVQMPTPPRAPVPVPTQPRTPTPIQTYARTPTPVQTPNPIQMPTPPRTPTPGPTLARPPAPLPTSARTPTPVPTLARPPAPLPTSARTPTPVQTPTPLAIRTPVRTPTRIRTPTPLQMPTQVRALIPARTPTQIWTPTPARTPTPISSPGEVEASAAAPASESFGSSALPLEPPPEPASEPTTASPHQDLSPTPSVKPLPSVTNGFGSTQEPLPVLTPPATDFQGPTLGSTSRADSSATKLTDATSESVRVPIPGTDPFAATALPTSTNTFAAVGESCSVDKIAVRVIYCYGLRYILLKKSLEQQFPNCLLFEEERAAQATGEFEVFVDGKLVHSKKKGDGFVDEARLQKIMNVIEEEVRKRSLSGMPRRAEMLPSLHPVIWLQLLMLSGCRLLLLLRISSLIMLTISCSLASSPKPSPFWAQRGKNTDMFVSLQHPPIPAPPTLHVRSPSSNTSNSPAAWAGLSSSQGGNGGRVEGRRGDLTVGLSTGFGSNEQDGTGSAPAQWLPWWWLEGGRTRRPEFQSEALHLSRVWTLFPAAISRCSSWADRKTLKPTS